VKLHTVVLLNIAMDSSNLAAQQGTPSFQFLTMSAWADIYAFDIAAVEWFEGEY